MPCIHDSFDVSFFDNLPKMPPAPPWTPEAACMHVASGAPGFDGLEADFQNSLDYDALLALSELLNAAGAGHLPAKWRHARVTLIPKPLQPTERRPLTIMSCAY